MEWPKEMVQAMQEFLGDLTPEEFQRGIREFCLTQAEIYPGTNVIAAIRKMAKPEQDPLRSPYIDKVKWKTEDETNVG